MFWISWPQNPVAEKKGGVETGVEACSIGSLKGKIFSKRKKKKKKQKKQNKKKKKKDKNWFCIHTHQKAQL